MQIKVKLHGILRDLLPRANKGYAEIPIDNGTTISILLIQLEIKRRVKISVNKEIIEDHSQILSNNDNVHIFTSYGGG